MTPRRVGVWTLGLLAAVIVLLQLGRARREGGRSLDAAYAELAAVVDGPVSQREPHLRAARVALAHAAGAVVIDAEAIAALAVLDRFPALPDQTTPSAATEAAIVQAAESLLAQGRTREAVVFLQSADVQKRSTPSVRTLQRVAQRWDAARKR